jgi:8-amino-7-oxononanoate synthase
VSQALKTAADEPWRRWQVQSNAEKLRAGLRALGCEVRGEGHIVPWFIGDASEVDRISHILEKNGVFASAVRFPAVARDQAIVRFMLMATHTDEHIERTLSACAAAIEGSNHERYSFASTAPLATIARSGMDAPSLNAPVEICSV